MVLTAWCSDATGVQRRFVSGRKKQTTTPNSRLHHNISSIEKSPAATKAIVFGSFVALPFIAILFFYNAFAPVVPTIRCRLPYTIEKIITFR